jgi:acetyl-CoA acetyltransferase
VVTSGGNRADHPELLHDVVPAPNDYGHRSWILPYGYGGANTFFGLIQQRYMHEYGLTLDQLGKIAVTFRDNARLNENALLREELTLEQYKNSRLISDPIRFYDCVMRCAGASAIVMAAASARASWEHPPVYLGSYAARIAHQISRPDPDRLETGFAVIADKLFQATPRESLDFLQLYDDYPIAIVKTLEDLGFAPRGGGGAFIERTDISRSGTLPINTGGGLLSVGQPAIAGGFIPIVEAIRQLRHEAGARQLAKADTGLVTGIGLISYHSNLVVTSAALAGREPF